MISLNILLSKAKCKTVWSTCYYRKKKKADVKWILIWHHWLLAASWSLWNTELQPNRQMSCRCEKRVWTRAKDLERNCWPPLSGSQEEEKAEEGSHAHQPPTVPPWQSIKFQETERFLESCCCSENPGPHKSQNHNHWYLNLSNAEGQPGTGKLGQAARPLLMGQAHGPFPYLTVTVQFTASWQCFIKLHHKPHLEYKQISLFFWVQKSEYNFPMPNYIPYDFTERYAVGNTIYYLEWQWSI